MTGGEEMQRCHSEDPCSSPANHLPYNPPERCYRRHISHTVCHCMRWETCLEMTGYLASIVNDREICLPAWLLWSEELWMAALFCRQFLHKGAIGRPGKPALLIQQGQNTRWVGLTEDKRAECVNISHFHSFFCGWWTAVGGEKLSG